MKNILLFLLLALSIISRSQSWSEPVQINTLQGYNANPDFYINDGTIHCVWSYRYNQNHRVIFYSQSTDDGTTWSNPENVSQNDTLWMENPHIVADSENNLHLTYDYNSFIPGGTLIMYRYYNGETWTDADTVSPGWYGARHNRLVIDSNDLLYCFWFHDFQNGTEMYRTLGVEGWSDINFIYDNYDHYFLQKAIPSPDNKLHCTGYYYFSDQSYHDQEIVYSTFHNSIWSDITQVSIDYMPWAGNDIALGQEENPHIVWRQTISNAIPADNGTMYSKLYENTWTIPELIIENASFQTIAIDMYNNEHIVNNEEYDDMKELVHYQKMNDEWIGVVVEENLYGFACIKLESWQNFIHMVYLVGDTVYSEQSETSINYRKYDIVTNIKQDELFKVETFSVYPNPAAGNLNISFNINEDVKTEINVFNVYGKLTKTLLNNYKSQGKYKLRWDLTDNEGSIVKLGTYFIQIRTGKYIMTKKVIIVV